jgi:integrase
VTAKDTTNARIKALPPLFQTAVQKTLVFKHRSPKTIVNALSHLVPFAAWLAREGVEPEAVTGDDLDRYFMQHTGATSTINEARMRIKWAYSYAVKRGDMGVRVNPFVLSEYEPPVASPEEPVTIPYDELAKMPRRCKSDNAKTLLVFLAFTGMRVDEVRRLMWSDVDWETRSISFVGKGNKRRTLPLHPILFDRLVEVRPIFNKDVIGAGAIKQTNVPTDGAILTASQRLSHRESAGEPYQDLTKLKREFTDYRFHDFRRTVATDMIVRNKIPEGIAFKILGWSRKTIFDSYYANVDVEALHEAIEDIYARDPWFGAGFSNGVPTTFEEVAA